MPWERIQEEQAESNSGSLTEIGKSIARHPARTAFNIGSRILGTPGDIANLIPEKDFTGKLARQVLPTTENIREKGYERSEGFLQPQNKVEQFIDEVVEDAASLLIPGGAATKGAKFAKPIMKGIKALGASLGANLIGETTQQVTGNQKAGSLAKMGSLFFLTLMGQPSAIKQIGEMYGKAESLIPEGATVANEGLKKSLQNLEKKITAGRPIGNLSKAEKFAYDELEKVKNLAEGDSSDVRQLWAQKRSLNSDLAGAKMFDLSKKEQQGAKKLALPLVSHINETIGQYGKHNPEFYKLFKDAEVGFGAIGQSKFIHNFLEKRLKYNPVTIGLLHLFGGPIGATTAAAVVPYQAIKIGYQIAKSPALRKIYTNTVKSAIKQDAITFNKELEKLDHLLQKSQSSEKWERVD